MKNKLKIQIIGWLLLIVSMLVAGSMIGYDLTEEPSLVAQKINNPFNILGVYIGFYLMKLGFGYAALLFPVILATVSYYLISNFSFKVVIADKLDSSNGVGYALTQCRRIISLAPPS